MAVAHHYVRDELIGAEAWRALVARYGGGDLLVPVAIATPNGQTLAALIGEIAARKLIGYAGGTRIYVHAGYREVLAARYAEICAMRAKGMTLREIAAIEWPTRYSERNIVEIVNGRRGALEALQDSESEASQG